jgi:hypothetical protein
MNDERNLRRTREEQRSVKAEESDVRSRPPIRHLSSGPIYELYVHAEYPFWRLAPCRVIDGY